MKDCNHLKYLQTNSAICLPLLSSFYVLDSVLVKCPHAIGLASIVYRMGWQARDAGRTNV